MNFHFLAFSAKSRDMHVRTRTQLFYYYQVVLFFIKMEVLFFIVLSPLPPSRRSTRTGRWGVASCETHVHVDVVGACIACRKW